MGQVKETAGQGMDLDPDMVIGIDPGLANTGWGVVREEGSRIVPVAYGCVTTRSDMELPARLAIIHDNLCEVISRYRLGALCAESVYFGANAPSAIATAQARGAALVACACMGLSFGEYTPLQIKKALVGTGKADKAQVQYMVRAVLGLDHDPKPDHAADALACAITHLRMRRGRGLEQAVACATGLDPATTKRARGQARRAFERKVAAAMEKEALR